MDTEHQETRFDQPLAGDQEQPKPEKKQNHREAESNNGGLFFKLKMPKTEPLGQNQSSAAPEFARICEVCNKGFSSGKALGGHMRMHVQANRELLQSRKNKISKPEIVKTNNSDLGSSNAGGGNCVSNGNSKLLPVCCVCGKNFPSVKSLYGHMRSHPEREWRGIQPPPTTTAKNSSSSTLSDVAVPDQNNFNNNNKVEDEDQIDDSAATPVIGSKDFSNLDSVIDLSKTLPSWSLTARRGRKSVGSSATSESVSGLDLSPTGSCEEEQITEEAVHDLMMLAKAANPCFSGCSEKGRSGGGAEMSEATNSNFFITTNNHDKSQVIEYVGNSKKRKEIDENGVSGGGFYPEKSSAKFLKLGLMEEDNNNNIEAELSDSQNSESIVLASMKRRKRRKMKLIDLEGVVQMQKQLRYKCSLCDKSFPTHQALGGHMSSHNKLKNNMIIQSDDQAASADLSAAEDGHNNVDEPETTLVLEEALGGFKLCSRDLERSSGLGGLALAHPHQPHQAHHQCKICNKTFPTGQALGGHKRCHWSGPTEQQQLAQSSTQVTSSPSHPNAGRKVHNFDLNELPSMEFEEGTNHFWHEAAGFANSSYNSVA